MPFVEDKESQANFSRAIGLDEIPEAKSFTFKEQMLAAYRLDNTIGSFIAKENGLPDGTIDDKNFDVFSHLTEEEKLDKKFVDNVALADNLPEIEAVRKQRERESKDKEVLSDGILAPLVTGLLDPINMIPVAGVTYKTYKNGGSILTSALAAATTNVGITGAQEAILHQTQLTRTYGDSAANMTIDAFLGGVIGGTPLAIKNLIDRSGSSKEKLSEDIEKTFDPENRINAGENPAMNDGSISAARVDSDPQVRGKLARAVTKFIGFDPLSRTITSNAKTTRQTSARLAENPLDVDDPGLASVESNIKVHDGKYYESITDHLNAYTEYQANGGTLKRRQFGEEVGKAVRNNSDDVHIQKAADSWKKKLYAPIKDMAIKARMLPEDVDVTTAENYLNRLWNKQKLASKRDYFNSVVSRWLMGKNEKLDLEDAESLSDEIADRILNTPGGRLDYDYKIGENRAKGKAKDAGLKSPFKSRSFDIPDNLVEEFLENDIEVLGMRYLRDTAPDIELINEFGDIDLSAERRAINEEYSNLAKGKTEKERLKLEKSRNKDISDLIAMRDRLRGTYAMPDWNNPWVRAGRVARDLNYMRLLGGVVASSIPDVTRVMAAEGIANTFSKGLKPLVSNLRSFKLSAEEAKRYGVGVDVLMGGRSEIIADTMDYTQGGTKFERAVRSASAKFSNVNLMNYWTGGIKQLHAVVTQSRIADDLVKGKIDGRLAQLGIDDNNAKNIARQLKKYGKKIDGVWVANTKDWDAQSLASMWAAAIRKESDRVVIVPGQEKPLFMSSELGKTVFQFKSFMFSATQRVLISNLQRQDKEYMQGILGLVSLGMMSYAFKQWDAGREVSSDPRTLVIEGIDRSGMLGILMEMNNTMEKVSSNNYGLRPLLGVSAPASRYASRNMLDSMVGPTFGLALDAITASSAVTGEREWARSDTRAVRRLLPGQNLTFLRQGFDEIEKAIE